MTRPVLFLSLVALAVSLLVPPAHTQAGTPALEILEPADGGWYSGDMVVRAEIEPPAQPIERVLFFVDGRLVCTVEHPPLECAWNAGPGVRSHVFRVVAVLAGGTRLVSLARTRGAEYVETGGIDMVHVTATVLDGGRFVQGLGSKAFRVFEDNRPQPIDQFAAEASPLELVIAIDISDSMTGAIDRVKESVRQFLSALRPGDRVTLAVFNEHFFVLAPPSADLADRLKALDRIVPSGATSLHEAIVRSFDLFGKQRARRGLIVLTDGDDTSSRIPREEVERRSETSDAVLYMIGQGQAVTSAGLKSLCERLASRSGGRAFFPRQAEEVDSVFRSILEEMSNQYFLSYPMPSATRDGRFHRIRVEVEGGYQVRARQGYRLLAR